MSEVTAPMHDQTIPYTWDRLMSYPSDPVSLAVFFDGEEDGKRFIADCGGDPEDWGDATDTISQLCQLRIPHSRREFDRLRGHAVACIQHGRREHRADAWREDFISLTAVPVRYIHALLEVKAHAVSNWQKIEMTRGLCLTGTPAEYARELPWHQDYGVRRGYTVPTIQRLHAAGVPTAYATAVADSGASPADIIDSYHHGIAPEFVIGNLP